MNILLNEFHGPVLDFVLTSCLEKNTLTSQKIPGASSVKKDTPNFFFFTSQTMHSGFFSIIYVICIFPAFQILIQREGEMNKK